MVLAFSAACGSSGGKKATAPRSSAAPAADVGHIAFVGGDSRRIFRVEARPNGRVEDVSARLESLSRKGDDNWVAASPDGQWLLIETERFDKDCAGYSCLALVAGDLSSGESVRVNGTNGELLRASQPGTIGPGGRVIVYPGEGKDGHDTDLFATTLTNGVWSVPVRLTGASQKKFNIDPALSNDGSRVVFTCGTEQYGGGSDASICEVHTDGSGFRVLLDSKSPPTGVTGEWTFRSPRYEPDGSTVFIVQSGSQLWRLAPGAPEPVRISTSDSDSSALCVLPDGRLATSWGGQPGFKDYTLIMRVTSRSAQSAVLPAPKTKVSPGPLGCSR
jgi:hypothetical protein